MQNIMKKTIFKTGLRVGIAALAAGAMVWAQEPATQEPAGAPDTAIAQNQAPPSNQPPDQTFGQAPNQAPNQGPGPDGWRRLGPAQAGPNGAPAYSQGAPLLLLFPRA